jgi:hypothetical protein
MYTEGIYRADLGSGFQSIIMEGSWGEDRRVRLWKYEMVCGLVFTLFEAVCNGFIFLGQIVRNNRLSY